LIRRRASAFIPRLLGHSQGHPPTACAAVGVGLQFSALPPKEALPGTSEADHRIGATVSRKSRSPRRPLGTHPFGLVYVPFARNTNPLERSVQRARLHGPVDSWPASLPVSVASAGTLSLAWFL
jgi:hypothetical protein